MSDRHPYWTYGPDHGRPVLDALAEGRRAFALELAFSLIGDQNHSQVIEAACAFEAYLKDEEADGRLATLERRHRLLAAMEANDVRQWEHFGKSVVEAADGE